MSRERKNFTESLTEATESFTAWVNAGQKVTDVLNRLSKSWDNVQELDNALEDIEKLTETTSNQEEKEK